MSRRTAEMALVALREAWRLSAPRRNGVHVVPDDWKTAVAELIEARDAADSLERTDQAPTLRLVSPFEEIDVVEASKRLGIGVRAVQKKCASGALPARRVGRSWLVKWTEAA